jgi:magnesium-protoporphyrin IX monomethyl ester (oxidative) cyclase
MPFGNPSTPSLALSLLKAGLKNHGIDCRIEYHSLVFAKAIGPEFYLVLGSYPQLSFLGEWVFSQSAFGYRQEAHDESLGQLLAAKDRTSKWIGRPDVFPSDLKDRLIGAREKVEAFVNFCVDEIENVRPHVLGFTTMFSQNCSSLAVARRVKERLGKDAPAIIFGGSNCEGIMGYTMLKVFPWIDYVCCGEGDHAFIEFAANILSGTSLRVEGILGHKGKAFDEFSPARPRY